MAKAFLASNGVRQDCVFSPYLFTVHFDLSRQLHKVKSSSFVGNTRVNHFIYADDICCFSPSLDGLQDILNICNDFAEKHEIIFTCTKSLGVFFRCK